MKNLLRFLLLGCFFVIVFIPIRIEYEWVVWALIVAMFGLVAAYYWALYGVTAAQAASLTDEAEVVRYSRFAGLVTGHDKSLDLIRGRFLITDTRILFIRKAKKGFELAETIPLGELSEYRTAKLLSYRRGIIFTLEDEREYRFTISRIQREEAPIRSALGW